MKFKADEFCLIKALRDVPYFVAVKFASIHAAMDFADFVMMPNAERWLFCDAVLLLLLTMRRDAIVLPFDRRYVNSPAVLTAFPIAVELTIAIYDVKVGFKDGNAPVASSELAAKVQIRWTRRKIGGIAEHARMFYPFDTGISRKRCHFDSLGMRYRNECL